MRKRRNGSAEHQTGVVVVGGNLGCSGPVSARPSAEPGSCSGKFFSGVCRQHTPAFGRKVLSTRQEKGWSCLEDSTVQVREQPGAAACGHQAGGNLSKAAWSGLGRPARMIHRGLAAWLEKVVTKFILGPERCTSLQLCRDCTCELMKAASAARDSSLGVRLYMLREKCLASRDAIHKAH